MQIKTIGIDLGKTACEVVAMDGCSKVVRRRRLWRRKPVTWLANLPPARIGLAASCGAHRLACRLAALDHGVKLMPAQYVRPLVKTNKHDQADPRLRLCRAEGKQAIAEAGQRPEMRFLGFRLGSELWPLTRDADQERGAARPAGATSGARAAGHPAHRAPLRADHRRSALGARRGSTRSGHSSSSAGSRSGRAARRWPKPCPKCARRQPR